MNRIHAITDRLGNKGTLALLAVLFLVAFAALDSSNLIAPSPKVTLLEEAWQSYDRAALSRDAPNKAFDSALEPLTQRMGRLEALTSRAPQINLTASERATHEAAEQAFRGGLTDLRECQAWLRTYRQLTPSTDPNPTRDNARDHIDACTAAHPVKPAPGRLLADP